MKRILNLIMLILTVQTISIPFSYYTWGIYSTELYVVPSDLPTSIYFGFLLSLIPISFSFLMIKLLELKAFKLVLAIVQSLVISTWLFLIIFSIDHFWAPLISIACIPLFVLLMLLNNFEIKRIITVIFSASSSTLLAITLPLYAILILSLVLAAFDVYLVFKGPLSKGAPWLSLTVNLSDITIGVGDLIFYSLIPISIMIHKGVMRMFISCLLINVGAAISVHLLSKREILPGLPIPLSLCLPLFF